MKYLFINSVAGVGSTGRIVAQTCRKLQQQGHTCVIAYGREKANCEDLETVAIGASLDYKLHGVLNRITDRHGFYSRRATARFLNWVRTYDPDVIWLHNIHGYYLHIGLLFEYLKQSGKQVKWTLHDCWAFTGHCAYFDFARCDRWKTGCHDCPQKKAYPTSLLRDGSKENYAKKKSLFTGVPNMTLITPSKWLADLAGIGFLGEYPIEVSCNTVNTEVFCPTEGDFRSRYGLEEKILLLGVAGVWDARKGLRDFLRLAQMLDDSYRIVLVGLSDKQLRDLPANVIGLKRTNNAKELAHLYTTADVFVNPTYEDNYPTVNLEARACGTRIVCYDTGGCPETIGEGDTLVPKGDVEALCACIRGI